MADGLHDPVNASIRANPGAAGYVSSLFRYPSQLPAALRGGAVALGNFDGVHLGHRHVIKAAQSHEKPCIALSLYPHPLTVLRPGSAVKPLSTPREKCICIGQLGVEALYLVHFTKALAALDAPTFIQSVLVDAIQAARLVVGEDAAIGRGREGDVAFLSRYLPARGIELEVVPELTLNGIRPSSRRIRELIEVGDVQAAARLLGGPFFMNTRVVHGDARGRQIGFPTANLLVRDHALPSHGVYACRVTGDRLNHMAVTNVGIRPTFGGGEPRVEVHILDLPECSLYGQRVQVSFIDRIRSEQRFESIEELKGQIARDCSTAREILSR